MGGPTPVRPLMTPRDWRMLVGVMWTALVIVVVALLFGVTIYDVLQTRHAILRNFPIVGHFRYLLEAVGPELRQYIVTNNNEERPFSRDQRRWIYASSKQENNYFGFGTDNDLELSPNHIVIRHSPFPLPEPHPGDATYDEMHRLPCAKILGEHRDRPGSFEPSSVVNVSGMSFGSLSGNAVAALNEGSKLAGCLHNTGEGGVSVYHRRGGELVWQLGTGYFGCRNEAGRFDENAFLRVIEANPVRAVELKLSQGAKPGVGGLLPAAKITAEIAAARGVPMGRDCASPSHHQEFHSIEELLTFVERLAAASGLPVGIKSAVGQVAFWHELAEAMVDGTRGVDFITVDGGEGGTGAAPLVFSDHVALPFKQAFAEVFRAFASRALDRKVVFFGSGKLGFPEQAIAAFCLGCDGINVGREAMMAIGCIQAQRCHNNHCPTGVATQNPWLARGLDPANKAVRLANYVVTLRKEISRVTRACGVEHPAALAPDTVAVLDEHFGARSLREVFNYDPRWGVIREAPQRAVN